MKPRAAWPTPSSIPIAARQTASTPVGADWLDPGMRSLALIPLGQGEAHIGLLILGSEEIQRFYPEMGTLFLERIGELVSAAAQRTLRTLHTLRTPHTLGPATQ
jgi:hypothetical protein